MKKTIILIHGYLTDYLDFNHLPKELIKYYDYVVIVSIPGHGKFNEIKNFRVDPTIKTVEDEVEFYLKKGSVDLIGFSMGGALTRYLCVKYQTIRKAVMLAPATYYLSPFCVVNRLKYVLKAKTADERKQIINRLKKNDDATKSVALDNCIKKFGPKNGLTFCKLITKINQLKGDNPTSSLIVWGELDELVPKKSAKFCYKNCSNKDKELWYIDGLGHLMLRTDYEEEINNKIIKFLNK